MVDPIMGHFPLLGEDDVVLLDCVLNSIGSGQDLLMVLFSVCLDPMDLGPMGSPLLFSTVYLETRKTLVGHQKPYIRFSHPGFQFQYPGEKMEHHSSSVLDCLHHLV